MLFGFVCLLGCGLDIWIERVMLIMGWILVLVIFLENFSVLKRLFVLVSVMVGML